MPPVSDRNVRVPVSDVRALLQRALGDAYTIERELGGGGMAYVFVAFDHQLERRVVVKVLPPELTATLSVERFRREILMAAALQHPHIVPVLTSGVAEGLPYFLMPFVEGESLREAVRKGPMPIRDAVQILRDVARALAFAHERGVVHRDIKPDNVLLSAGSATVTDFGVAKALVSARTPSRFHEHGTLTGQGTSLGTPAYMAPEQAAGDPDTDHRADIYAAGIVAYEMLTGKPPFTGKTPQALLAAQLAEAPVPVQERRKDVPDALAAVVMRCLEKEADKRPQTAEALVALLDDPAVVSGTFSTASRDALAAASLRRGPLALAAIFVVLVAGVGGALLMRARDVRAGRVTTPVSEVSNGAPAPNSVAVLPFTSIGPDTQDVYLAEGITVELTSALSRIAGLRVASRMQASDQRQRGGDIAAVGKALHVATVLEGTIQRDGKRIRLTARLVRVSDGLTVWSDVFERVATDLFKVQAALARSITEALTPELAPSETTQVAEKEVDPKAYDSYLRGRELLSRPGPATLSAAAAQFRAAIARDSGFALAHAGLADAYAIGTLTTPVPSDTGVTAGLAQAERALALDSTLGEGYAARGHLRSLMGDGARAEADLARAVQRAPEYANGQLWYGEHLLRTGRPTEGLAALRKARTLDQNSPVVASALALGLASAGRKDSAVKLADDMVESFPDLPIARAVKARVLRDVGDTKGALKELEAAASLSNGAPPFVGLLGGAYAQAGQLDRAQGALARLLKQPAAPGAPGAIAVVYLGLKDTANAMAWLLKAADKHDQLFRVSALADKEFDVVRADPRFAELARRLGLPAKPVAPAASPSAAPSATAPVGPSRP
ncbi:MAG: protein kinase [Gemmatimonadetes bacterium]|nr:protein kinase [Gemmatimonadota bacterium]